MNSSRGCQRLQRKVKEQIADVKNTIEVRQDTQQRLVQEKDKVRQVCALQIATTYGTNRGRLLETRTVTRTDDDRGYKHDMDTIQLHALDVVQGETRQEEGNIMFI